MKKNLLKNLLWTSLWLVSFALLVVGPRELWENNNLFTIFAAFVNLVLIVSMLYSNKNLFKSYDELQKTINLKATAVTLFLTVFLGLFWEGIYHSGLFPIQPRFSLIVVFSSISMIVSSVVISRQYS